MLEALMGARAGWNEQIHNIAYGRTHALTDGRGGGMLGQEHAADYCRTAAVTASDATAMLRHV